MLKRFNNQYDIILYILLYMMQIKFKLMVVENLSNYFFTVNKKNHPFKTVHYYKLYKIS